ncbi:MAG: DivIVA domain-containing protein [Oscillospiraceae bacterium]
MGDVTGRFRTSVFGGFDRGDVVAYLEKIAGERNEYKEKTQKLEDELNAEREEYGERLKNIERELKTAREELTAAEKRAEEVRVSAVSDAVRFLDELKDKYENVRTDMEVTTNHLRCELTRLGDSLSLITSVFSKTGERFSELSEYVKGECEKTGNSIAEK